MLYLSKLPLIGHDNNAREEALRALAEKFVGIGCEIHDSSDDRYVIINPFLNSRFFVGLSFLAIMDKIEINLIENHVRIKIISTYSFVMLTVVALSLSFNIVDRLYYNAGDFMKAELTTFIAIILALMIFYVNALRAKGFARRALESG